LLSSPTGEDKVRYSELSPAVRHRGRVADVLDQLGLLDDDRVPAFETWLQRKLDGIAPGIRKEAEDWIRALHDGGSRTRPRSPTTVWHYFNEALGFPSYRGDIGAPRGAWSYPRCSREELGGRFLGLMAYLDSKG
jgi:hypothetical protein